jgi:uncharacterized protein (TIGR02231 family)
MTSLLFPLVALLPLAQEPRSQPSSLVEVTVYPGWASVKRRAELGGASGRLVLSGLPAGLDPDSLRVRLSGGEVVDVEVRDRLGASTPDARAAELAERIRGLERELAGIEDEAELQRTLLDHVQRLLRQEEETHQADVAGARPNPEAWEANYRYLAAKLKDVKQALREIEPRRAEKSRELDDARLALGRCSSAAGVPQKDVILDVVGAGTTLELEYLVGGASWQPFYDLRARKDLSAVELAFRARVQQQTGEDWSEAEVLLSTSQPQRGAEGPEPRPVWLSLYDPDAPALGREKARGELLQGLGYSGDAPASALVPEEAASLFASVESEGLSVRYRLPRRETIESGPTATTVLVGRAELSLTSEHYCVPALDTNVWMRGRAKNTSEWVLLPGRAAVYFGADFVGHASLEAVQPGQELELALGADPGLTLKRTQLADLREEAGVFRSRATERQAWRIELENHGAFSRSADGAVEVLVQEVLPRPRDERIKVAIAEVQPKVREDARWKKEREENGVLTWLVRAPRGGTATIELTTEVTFPEDLRLVRR